MALKLIDHATRNFPNVEHDGSCPKCGHGQYTLTYDSIENTVAMFTCKCPDCDTEWREAYTLRFRDMDIEGDNISYDFDDGAWIE